MTKNHDIKLTTKQDKLLFTKATGKVKGDADLFTAIDTVSKEHGVYKGIAREAVKEQAQVTLKGMDRRTFSCGLASLGNLQFEDEVKKDKDGKEVGIEKSVKIADAEVGMTSIAKGHWMFTKLTDFKANMVASLMKADGVSRMTAHRWIDEVWETRGLTLKQRDLAEDDSRKASGLAVLKKDKDLKAYHEVAKTAYEMVRDAIDPTSKKEWGQLAKVLRQMEKEAVARSK